MNFSLLQDVIYNILDLHVCARQQIRFFVNLFYSLFFNINHLYVIGFLKLVLQSNFYLCEILKASVSGVQ